MEFKVPPKSNLIQYVFNNIKNVINALSRALSETDNFASGGYLYIWEISLTL